MSVRRHVSATTRVLTAMNTVLAVSLALVVVVAYLVTAATLRNTLDSHLRSEADAYAAAMAGAPAGDDLAKATRAYLAERTSRGAGFDPVLAVAFDDGRVISNSGLALESAAPTAVATGGPASMYADVKLAGAKYRVLFVPVYSKGDRIGVFAAALTVTGVNATARSVAFTLGGAALIALALGVALAYLATQRSLRPLRRMASDVATIDHREPGRRVAYDGPDNDELGVLAGSLNDMLGRLENAYADQRRFVADASHELRTPVAVIRGNVELLRSGHADAEETEEGLALIESETVRMTALLNELLGLARLESTGRRNFQPLDVAVLADEVRARARMLGQQEFTMEGTCDVWVDGDPDLLDQALANIVRNAVAHTGPGGRIAIACTSDDSNARITITDDGPGIPEESLARIFDRFYRGEAMRKGGAVEGAGLGLAIARRLIELHRGTLTAENAEPHGARFTVTLPRIAAPENSE